MVIIPAAAVTSTTCGVTSSDCGVTGSTTGVTRSARGVTASARDPTGKGGGFCVGFCAPGPLGLDWPGHRRRRRRNLRVARGVRCAKVLGVVANHPCARFVSLATQHIAQSTKSLRVVRVLLT